MLNVLNLDQDFGWQNQHNINITSDKNFFEKLPNPKIVLLNDRKWFDFDRSTVDLVVFWTSESLAFERAKGKEIKILSSKDRIFSSSTGPSNSFNLQYYLYYIQCIYRLKYKLLIPKNEIYNNNMLSTLGTGRLHRAYMYCKFLEEDLINKNISYSFTQASMQLLNDANNELPGQDNIKNYVLKNSKLFKDYQKLELDWRKYKNNINFYNQSIPGIVDASIIPTKAYLDSSLLYISETVPHNKEFFITEKTIKGLLSGRPFIIIGCQHFLKYLRLLGFMTWNNVLDESYDDEEDLCKRIDRSISSAKEFIQMNVLNYPKKLALIQSITNHNKKILFEIDWSFYQKSAINLILNDLGLSHS